MCSKLAVLVATCVVSCACGTSQAGLCLLQTNAVAKSVSSRSSSASSSTSKSILATQLARIARSWSVLMKDASSSTAKQYLDGASAPLNQTGYEMSLGRVPMRTFAQRVIDEEGLQVSSLVDLHEFLKYYDGTCQKQSYSAMVEELHRHTTPGKCHSAWVSSKTAPKSLAQIEGIKQTQIELQAEKEIMAGAMAAKMLSSMKFERSDLAMEAFVTQVVQKLKGEILNDQGLRAFVIAFSNRNKSTGPFRTLMQELHSIADRGDSWLRVPKMQVNMTDVIAPSQSPETFVERKSAGIGNTAPLSDEGYTAVVNAIERDDAAALEMCTFVNRTLANEGFTLIKNSGLLGLCPWYSGECAKQSYHAMVSELRVAAEKSDNCGGGWLAGEVDDDDTNI